MSDYQQLSADHNAWNHYFSRHQSLISILEQLEEFVTVGPMRGWNPLPPQWNPAGTWIRRDFDLTISREVRLTPLNLGIRLLSNRATARQGKDSLLRDVEYRYAFTITLERKETPRDRFDLSQEDEATRARLLKDYPALYRPDVTAGTCWLQEFINPNGRSFEPGWYRAESQAGYLGDLGMIFSESLDACTCIMCQAEIVPPLNTTRPMWGRVRQLQLKPVPQPPVVWQTRGE